MSKKSSGGDHPAIEARGLVKVFGGNRALDGIDLTIGRGQVFGFVGPNGAGKTTTIRILATLTRPDGGTARVLGHDVTTEAHAIRARVAVTGQYASLDEDLTGRENLLILGRLHGLTRAVAARRADDLLAAFDLTRAAGRPVSGYSGGMRRRLDIGAGLITTPDVLFLDEPTTGLDPHSRNRVWELVRRIAATGTTVLLTTQYLEEADRLAERIAVIDDGRIVAEGTGAQLKSRVGAGTLHLRLLDGEHRPRALRILADVPGSVRLADDPLALSVALAGGSDSADVGRLVGHTMTRLADAGVGIAEFSLGRPSLDEAFLALTGRRTAPAGADHEESQA
ncbi:ATP-binding cassette domain-containing protein [Embleya sp. NPDC055664]